MLELSRVRSHEWISKKYHKKRGGWFPLISLYSNGFFCLLHSWVSGQVPTITVSNDRYYVIEQRKAINRNHVEIEFNLTIFRWLPRLPLIRSPPKWRPSTGVLQLRVDNSDKAKKPSAIALRDTIRWRHESVQSVGRWNDGAGTGSFSSNPATALLDRQLPRTAAGASAPINDGFGRQQNSSASESVLVPTIVEQSPAVSWQLSMNL